MFDALCTRKYPVEQFPEPLRTLIREIQVWTGVETEIIALELLATIAAVTQAKATIHIPPFPPTPLGIFVQLIANSGSGKGLIASILSREIRIFGVLCDEKFSALTQEFNFQHEEWQDRKEVLRRKRRKACDKGVDYSAIDEQLKGLVEPRKPTDKNLVRSDVSVRSLIEDLAAPGASIYLTHNEGSEFYRSDLSGHLGTLCSAYSGEELGIRRVNKRIDARTPKLTINCRTQPAVFDKAVKGKIEQFVESGFYNRSFFARPYIDSSVIEEPRGEYETPTRLQFDQRVREMLSSLLEEADGETKVLQLSPDSLAEFHRLRESIARDVVAGQPLADISGAAQRLPENIARIAGAVYEFLGQSGPISLEYFQFAKAVGLWHLAEFKRLFSPSAGLSPLQINAARLEEFFREKYSEHDYFDGHLCVMKRRLVTSGPFRKRHGGKDTLDSALQHLANQQKIRMFPGPPNREETGAWIQLSMNIFGRSGRTNVQSSPVDVMPAVGSHRDFSLPCRCIRCRY